MKEKVFINELEMLEIGSHFFKKKLVHFGTETGFFSAQSRFADNIRG